MLKASRDKSHVFVEGWVKEGERRVAAFRAIIVSAGKKKYGLSNSSTRAPRRAAGERRASGCGHARSPRL